tara:strand:+ start:372 stop:929 length:558 start_codon:yes stop_codon:yes gene_type:complete
MKKTPFKMKGFSGFGNSPMKQDKPKLPKAESMSTQTAPVITPTTGELVDPHHQMEGYGYKAEMKTLDKKSSSKPAAQRVGKMVADKFQKKESFGQAVKSTLMKPESKKRTPEALNFSKDPTEINLNKTIQEGITPIKQKNKSSKNNKAVQKMKLEQAKIKAINRLKESGKWTQEKENEIKKYIDL